MPNPNPKINPDAQFKPGNDGGPGRASVDPDGNTKPLKTFVSESLAQWYATRAKTEHKSLSEYIRDVLLKHHEETTKP